MISTNLSIAEIVGFYTASIADTLQTCNLEVCQTHIAPTRPQQLTCCPCSCQNRGGFTITTWVDRITYRNARTGLIRCPCLTSIEIGTQIGRCWPKTTKCESAAQTETLDAIYAAMQCISEALCCGNLLEGINPDGRPMCEAIEPRDIVTLRDCDTDPWFDGNVETCCAGFELVVALR